MEGNLHPLYILSCKNTRRATLKLRVFRTTYRQYCAQGALHPSSSQWPGSPRHAHVTLKKKVKFVHLPKHLLSQRQSLVYRDLYEGYVPVAYRSGVHLRLPHKLYTRNRTPLSHYHCTPHITSMTPATNGLFQNFKHFTTSLLFMYIECLLSRNNPVDQKRRSPACYRGAQNLATLPLLLAAAPPPPRQTPSRQQRPRSLPRHFRQGPARKCTFAKTRA